MFLVAARDVRRHEGQGAAPQPHGYPTLTPRCNVRPPKSPRTSCWDADESEYEPRRVLEVRHPCLGAAVSPSCVLQPARIVRSSLRAPVDYRRYCDRLGAEAGAYALETTDDTTKHGERCAVAVAARPYIRSTPERLPLNLLTSPIIFPCPPGPTCTRLTYPRLSVLRNSYNIGVAQSSRCPQVRLLRVSSSHASGLSPNRHRDTGRFSATFTVFYRRRINEGWDGSRHLGGLSEGESP